MSRQTDAMVIARELGIEKNIVLDALDFQDKFYKLFTTIEKNYPETIASVRLDRLPAKKGYISFVGENIPLEIESLIAAIVGQSGKVAVISGKKFSRKQRTDRVKQVSKSLSKTHKNMIVSIDPETEKMIIKIFRPSKDKSKPPTARETALIINENALNKNKNFKVNESELQIETIEKDGPFIELHAIHRGGSKIQNSLDAYCTSGFTVYKSSPYIYGMLTAGHCLEPYGMNWFYDYSMAVWGYLGYGQADVGTSGDAGFQSLGLNSTGYYDFATPYFHTRYYNYYTNQYVNESRPVYGSMWPVVNAYVCRFGRVTNIESCGYITHIDLDITIENIDFGNMVLTSNATSQKGDSGGPWYSGNYALGTNTGNYYGYGVFMPIHESLSLLNVNLSTTSP
ncbi:S1 family peptidase [Thiofilum flexile]|uniref:S1 family peptidase n=1 Tax=Thiofilum flexile TaxID=125627 RepID=UPI00037EBAC2|nr:S1 family peptidase [Thiofilum flexile]